MMYDFKSELFLMIGKNCKTIATILSVFVFVGACSKIAIEEHHGYAPTYSDVNSAVKGKLGKEQTVRFLGTPSMISEFDDNKWYYLSYKTSYSGFYFKNIVSYNLYEINFKNNKVYNVSHYNKSNLKEINISAENTKSYGKEYSIIDNILNNFSKGKVRDD